MWRTRGISGVSSSTSESDIAPRGLSEDIVRLISAKKGEPEWMLEWRLKAFRHWLTLNNEEPKWANIEYPPIDFQDIIYYAAPKSQADSPKSLDEVDPEIREAFDKLGIPLEEQKRLTGVAVDAVLDSASVATTYRKMLEEAGVILLLGERGGEDAPGDRAEVPGHGCAVHRQLLRGAQLGSVQRRVVRICSAGRALSDRVDDVLPNQRAGHGGSSSGRLIIADKGAYVSYLEGCTAPMRKTHQLHAAVVELVTLDDAEIKYSTLQNWYPGDKEGNGGVYNFVTKRGAARGRNSKISWTQVETGSAITWKYPSVILQGDNSVGEFYSVALVNNFQQADTGTKMIHIGKNTKSTIIAKGISAGQAQNTYRGQVKIMPSAMNARNFTQCDSLLIGDQCGAHTVPYIEVRNPTAQMGHEATTSKVDDNQLFYLQQRGIGLEEANYMIINGFCRGIFKELPFEFAAEASQLLRVNLEGTVG